MKKNLIAQRFDAIDAKYERACARYKKERGELIRMLMESACCKETSVWRHREGKIIPKELQMKAYARALGVTEEALARSYKEEAEYRRRASSKEA